jgi:VanZ family protein
MRFLIYRLPALAYMGLIFFSSSRPMEGELAKAAPDWILHALAYLVLYLLVFWAIHEGIRPRPGRGAYLGALLITVLYGATDEYHQSYVPARDASMLDLLADAIGGAIAALLVRLHVKSRMPKDRHAPARKAARNRRISEDSRR